MVGSAPAYRVTSRVMSPLLLKQLIWGFVTDNQESQHIYLTLLIRPHLTLPPTYTFHIP